MKNENKDFFDLANDNDIISIVVLKILSLYNFMYSNQWVEYFITNCILQ